MSKQETLQQGETINTVDVVIKQENIPSTQEEAIAYAKSVAACLDERIVNKEQKETDQKRIYEILIKCLNALRYLRQFGADKEIQSKLMLSAMSLFIDLNDEEARELLSRVITDIGTYKEERFQKASE